MNQGVSKQLCSSWQIWMRRGIEAAEKMIEQREMTIRRMLDILELLVRERNKNEGAIDTRE